MNMKAVIILLVLSLATILALVAVLLSGTGKSSQNCDTQSQYHGDINTNSAQKKKTGSQNLIFADLKPEEFSATVDYLKKNLGKDLVSADKAKPTENCIYYIDVKYPSKQKALDYLDNGGEKPNREALAVVFFGDQEEPNITEYVVGPLPNPSYHKDITLEKYKDKLPYYRRPVIGREYADAYDMVYQSEFSKAPNFLRALGYDGDNFAALTTVPRGFKSGDRSTWFVMFLKMKESCFSVHPVGLEILLDHKSLDVTKWKVTKVFYNGVYFSNMVDLEKQYNAGQIQVVKVKNVTPDNDIGSMYPKAHTTPGLPLQFDPIGKRYTVNDNQVSFQSWDFSFGLNVNTGLRLFDIRYNNKRIVYEISTQEAIAVYGSNAPGGMITRYLDGSFGIGRFSFELVQGVDCPYLATYVDTHHLMESETPETTKNSICIFEHNTGMPLRRHYSNMHAMYYGGLTNSVLVVRAVSTLINYDYVWDFIFYQNGVIEAKIYATGYISSSFYFADGKDYGSRVGEYTLGTLHTHFINYKVDIDVGGIANSVMTQDMQYYPLNIPWQTDVKIQRPKVVRNTLETENTAAFEQNAKMPRYIHIASNTTNKWGHPHSYRIQIVSFAGDPLPNESPVEDAMGWARYKLAVTKRKDDEPESSSIYNQNDPWSPTVNFSNFINDENIKDQDLVAWVTVGFLHIPHSEDLPNTATPGNGVGFFLRPYNYFDIDPSIYSPDGVYFKSEQDYSSCDVNQMACISKTGSCAPKIPPFTYEGFKDLVNL
ncbi:amine oxidase [copper-containing] 3-like [Pyxicephalus adspersus]|uniref:Amine oxidase n=1 Tax=Pyxicephalus adspersus TaxID=30357 RepID=A0AAV3A5G2_PYXAD|nr:TPA: hypothetical protein GDO54_013376 [Pyxicephalus adspersus]